MQYSDAPNYPRRRWIVAGVSLVAIGALSAGSVGIALALEPTTTASGQQVVASDAGRAHADATIRPQISALASPSGSLVGGEQQVLSGRGLATVDEIRVAGMTVTDVVSADRSVTFAMPRSERYVAGAVPIEVFADGQPVEAMSELSYAYEVRTGVDRQLEYAFLYWQDYNLAEYGTFNPSGGDCVNFVSQTLVARGWEMTGAWYNYGGTRWSSPWIFTPSFESWLLKNPQYGAVRLELDQRDQVKVGDIVVFDWNDNGLLDHIQIVSAIEEVDGRIDIKMVGHNRDSDLRDLDDTITIDHPNGFAYFYSLPPE